MSKRKVVSLVSLGVSAIMLLSGCGLEKTTDSKPTVKDGGSDHFYVDSDGFIFDRTMGYSVGHVEEFDNSFSLNDSATIDKVAESISELSNIDEILNGLGIDEAVAQYAVARQENNAQKMAPLLSKIGLLTLKAQILDALKINVNKVSSITINADDVESFTATIEYKPVEKVVTGGIRVEEPIPSETYVISGRRAMEILSIVLYDDTKLDPISWYDTDYSTIIEFVCASGTKDADGTIIFGRDRLKECEAKKTLVGGL